MAIGVSFGGGKMVSATFPAVVDVSCTAGAVDAKRSEYGQRAAHAAVCLVAGRMQGVFQSVEDDVLLARDIAENCKTY